MPGTAQLAGQRLSNRPVSSSLACGLRSRSHLRPSHLRQRATVAAQASAVGEKFPAQVCVVLGTQWGDEGKGKLVDILALQYDIVARAQVG